jgi:hypothetical protein
MINRQVNYGLLLEEAGGKFAGAKRSCILRPRLAGWRPFRGGTEVFRENGGGDR